MCRLKNQYQQYQTGKYITAQIRETYGININSNFNPKNIKAFSKIDIVNLKQENILRVKYAILMGKRWINTKTLSRIQSCEQAVNKINQYNDDKISFQYIP
eukprot:147582_1